MDSGNPIGKVNEKIRKNSSVKTPKRSAKAHKLREMRYSFALVTLVACTVALRAQSVDVLETRADGSALLARSKIAFGAGTGDQDTKIARILLSPEKAYLRMEGFGASMTESSASLLMKLPAEQRHAVMHDLFAPEGPLGLTLLRQPIGASDFSAHGDYSYDDVDGGDPRLEHFSAAADDADVFPLLREALGLNPQLRFMILPWSAPAWMKTSHTMKGGELEEKDVVPYASYLSKAVEAYAGRGLPVYAMALQNEPLNEDVTYPTELMKPAQEAELAAAVRPLLRSGGRTTLLLGYEHNWGNLEYPRELLADATKLTPQGAPPLFDAISFHCYKGNEAAQGAFLKEHPEMALWFTECSGENRSTFANDLLWQAQHLLLGAPQHGARSVMLWNIALLSNGGPHNGGCGDCRGLLTLEPHDGGMEVHRNVEFYLLAQAAPFVHPGAKEFEALSGGDSTGLVTTAYENVDGSFAVLVLNTARSDKEVRLEMGGAGASYKVPRRSLVTFHWGIANTTLSAGTYRLAIGAQCLAANADAVTLQPCSAIAEQVWTMQRLASGGYEVRNVATAQALVMSQEGRLGLLKLDGDHTANVRMSITASGVCFVPHTADSCVARKDSVTAKAGVWLTRLPVAK